MDRVGVRFEATGSNEQKVKSRDTSVPPPPFDADIDVW